MWFLSAERLRGAAEIILGDQVKQEISYFKAVDDAGIAAVGAAHNAPDGSASVEISCPPPNYLPARLLYAFAIENALKGLIVARNPGLVSPRKISKSIKSHDLIKLAKGARFSLGVQEVPILKALSHIAEWVGRYPVATELDKYKNPENPYPLGLDPDPLLDWDSQHPIMRVCFDRMVQELEKMLPRPLSRFGSVVAVRPPGIGNTSG